MLVPMHRVFQNPDRQAGKHTPHFLSSAARHHNAILRKGKKRKKKEKGKEKKKKKKKESHQVGANLPSDRHRTVIFTRLMGQFAVCLPVGRGTCYDE